MAILFVFAASPWSLALLVPLIFSIILFIGVQRIKKQHEDRKLQASMDRYCFEFADHGRCSYGASCRYRHVAGPEDSNATSSDRANSSTSDGRDELDDFFGRYPTFDYDRTRPSSQELGRLVESLRRPKQKKNAQISFRAALVSQFNAMYGIDGRDLAAWQALCVALEIPARPTSINACKKAIKKVHVNLIDLVDCTRSGGRIRKFKSVAQLAEYTITHKKYFPREEAKAGGILRFLLRPIV